MTRPLRKAAGKALVLVALVALLSGCGGGGAAPAPPAESVSATPLSCLNDSGLSSITARGPHTWRGFNSAPFFAVFVDELPSAARAARVVNEASDVLAAQAGRYAVTGPSLSTDDGGVVAAVAACLGG